MHASPRRTLAASLLFALALQPSAAQTPQPQPQQTAATDAVAPPPGACDAERALQLVRQQLSEAKALANGAQRAALMTRAAELLWPFDEAQARAALSDAFDVASSHYREHGVETTKLPPRRADAKYPGRTVPQPDPRLAVIRAAAARDRAWAERLAARAAEDTRRRALEGAEKARGEGEAGERLLSVARSLAATDIPLALSVARESLRHPASRFLGSFIHDVAVINREAADAFYADALRAYAGSDVASLLQLSAYPFALARNLGLRAGYSNAGHEPVKFAPSPELQRQFVAAFLRLSELRLRAAAGQPPPEDDPQRAADPEMIYSALSALEALYGASDRSFAARAEPLRQMAGGMLTGGAMRRAASGAESATRGPAAPEAGAADRIDYILAQARALKDPDQHDRRIVVGLWGFLGSERVERLEAVAAELKDEMVRGQFLDSLYFQQALRASRAGGTEEAARAAQKVRSLEQRSALVWDLMQAELKQSGDAPGARSLAESVHKSAQRAPESEERARALLGLAYFYSRVDPPRAPQLLGEAAGAINRAPAAGQGAPALMLTVDGRTYNFYTFSPAPGFNLDFVLREVAARDLDAALAAAAALEDRHLRAFAVLSSVARCLDAAAAARKAEANAKAARRREAPAAKKPAAAPQSPEAPKKRP